MKTPISLEISFGFCLLMVLLLLVVPLPWAAAMIGAAAFHELCHILAIMWCGGHIYVVKLELCGAQIIMSSLNCLKEAFAAAAGPLGSFLLLMLNPYFPEMAVCGLVQGAFNLLPMYPMDGGRILSSFLTFLIGRERGTLGTAAIQCACTALILIFACLFCLKYDLFALLTFLGLEIVLKLKKFLEKGVTRQYNRIDYES